MADFTALKNAIQTYIKQNGNEEITGEKLQEILLSVVTTLGDSAINNLITALADEVAARQNADGTLQQNITNEATARANGDSALSNRLGSSITAENTAADQIGAEAEAREAADTALQELIDGITENIANGYVYAGIATPSSTPATGKVFYLALTAGTYTNFGNTEVSQGINILKHNGSAWLLDAFIGIDDEPTPNSPKLVKSGGAFDSIMTDGSAFDISAHFASGGTLATYADLSAALAALNTLSASYKRGGMSIKFVRTSDNKYVQYRLMSDNFNTTVTNWQGVDDEPTANSKNLVASKGIQRDIRVSSANIRGLDFSSFTGNTKNFTKGIIFAGVVLANEYTPSTIGIYALAKNRNSDGKFDFWIWFGDADHTIKLIVNLSSLAPNTDGIYNLTQSSDYGTLYLIVDINAYTDGETVVFSPTPSEGLVKVKSIPADDIRIKWWNLTNATTSNSGLLSVNDKKLIDKIGTERNLDFSNFTGNKSLYTKGIIFAGVVLTDGYTPNEKPKIYALCKNKDNDGLFRIWLITEIGGDEHKIIGDFNLSSVSRSNDGIACLKATGTLGTLYAIVDINAYDDGEVVKYAITGEFVEVNTILASDQRIQNWCGEEIVSINNRVSVINSELPVIQSQFRCLDLSNFTGDKIPYYNAMIFAAAVRTGEIPAWQLNKIELYALGYNQNNNDRIQVGFYIGNDGTSSISMWDEIKNVSQLDEIPNIKCSLLHREDIGVDIYIIYNPKYIYDYYQLNHSSIIYGGTEGHRVCIENLLDSDPRIQAFNVTNVKNELEAELLSISGFWKNKKLVWYGTSIPAGSDPTLSQEGIGITYPAITASYLKATCNNEAVGSGRASYLAPVQGETYQHLMRCMGGTIASKLALLNDIYIIDDDNQTVTLGQNTYNVIDLPISGTPTYSQAVNLRLEAMRFSYEIMLVSRYLDNTGEYLQTVLNSQEVAESIHYSGNIYDLLHRTDMDYKFTPELFVFDHGTNDFSHMSENDNVASRDTTKFYGAMNMMYDLIQFFAPTALVCIVTDYGTSRYNSDLVIEQQQAWATYWQIPCLRTCDIVPWNGTIVTVQGYWDGGAENQGGVWHDTGFYFNVDGDTWETNNGIILRRYSASTPASTIINAYNIRTIHGKQVYSIPQKYKFFKDGLHPHTDTTGNALKLYARYLSRLICDFVAPNKD